MTDIYQEGETIRITAAITDSEGDPAEPTAIVISIEKPDGTLSVNGAAMSGSAGAYHYDYLIPSDEGVYLVKVKATGTGGRITIKPDDFKVEATI